MNIERAMVGLVNIMKYYPKKLAIMLCISCMVGITASGVAAYALSGSKSTSGDYFNARVTEEKFSEFCDSLIIPEEKQKIKLDSSLFESFDMATGEFKYKDMFSVNNEKFQPNALMAVRKKQAEEETPEDTSNNISGADSPSIYNINFASQRKNVQTANIGGYSQTSPASFIYSMMEASGKNQDNTPQPNNMAEFYEKNNQFDKACEIYKKLLDKEPEKFEYIYKYAVCLFKKGDYYTALDYFNKAMEINPSFADVYFNIGVALEHTEHKNLAKKYYSKCLELNPNDEQAKQAYERLN